MKYFRNEKNIDLLYGLSRKFRNAIEDAKLNGEFSNLSCLYTFPIECCDMTCDLLGQYLVENGIYTFQINAQSKFDHQRRHVWLVTYDEIVIDITGDQFSGQKGFERFIEPVIVGNETSVHKVFCRERYREENTVFSDPQYYTDFDGTPSYRQRRLIDAYKILKRYLNK